MNTLILGGLVALIKAIPVVDRLFQLIVVTYIEGQNQETKYRIVDAAALGARASTDAERYAASEAWQKALRRERYS